MTAKQKANRERFKKVVAEAKKLRKKNPKLTQAQAVKQAWAIMYSKKRAGVGAVKKKAAKKSSSYHKDTKSHNVNIRVMSGWKKGKTKFVEKGEKSPKRNAIRVRRYEGQFSSFKRIAGVNNINDNKVLLQISKEDKLKKAVITILKRMVKDYSGNYKSLFEDIMKGGLQSGIVSELIYYSDTTRWYKKYRKEIMDMLRETMSDLGTNSPAGVFGKKWDEGDPFAEDTQNQNLLAWYSFEETVYQLASRLGYEI